MDSMPVFQILTAAIAATSLMTLFSYWVSAAAREIYKEPLLLSYVLSFSDSKPSKHRKNVLAWILHYLIGIIFVAGYHFIWQQGIMDISWLSSIVLGICIGTIGIIGWMIIFQIIPEKPNINYAGYYLQLFAAHLIFSFTAFLTYSLFLYV